MKTEQALLLLITAVLGVLGWQTYRQLTAKEAARAPTALAKPDAAAGALARATGTPPRAFSTEAAPRQVEYAAEEMRDPFLSLLPQEVSGATAKQVELPTLHLQGLVYGQLKPRAIIDGHVVGEGDQFDEIEVLQIQREGVLLTYRNRRFFLKAGQPAR